MQSVDGDGAEGREVGVRAVGRDVRHLFLSLALEVAAIALAVLVPLFAE